MNQDQQSRWRPTRRQVLWTGVIVATAVVLAYIGYFIPRTGFGQTEVKEGVQPAKTLWDWMDLLIIPIVLAIGGFLFTRSENRATQAAAERQNRATQAAAERRAQEEALQAYLDQMSDTLIPKKEEPSLSDESPLASLKTVARARTLTVLPRLDRDGKGRVVEFLHESALISHMVQDEQGEMVVREKVVDLNGANLRDANLFGLILTGVALDGVNLERAALTRADLQNADLSFARLRDADLSSSWLSGADLTVANLSGASLPGAQLTSDPDRPERLKVATKAAKLTLATLTNANLSNADLSNTDLRYAVLQGTKLSGADLSGADLTEAESWTAEQLDKAKSLDGATMPDGRVLKGPENPDGPTFEEWRESLEEQG